MKVRGRRRCKECGNRWSYFETGTTTCPACGSLRSVGVEDDRTLHTDAPASLDLAEARSMLDDRPLAEVARAAGEAAREYVNSRGFVRSGELLELDEGFLLAAELRHVAGRLERALEVGEAEEVHFVDLLAGAEAGARPEDVPHTLRDARGLATVDAVGAYRRDVSAWLDEHEERAVGQGENTTRGRELRATVIGSLARLRDHERRAAALDGDVQPREAEALVDAARGIGDYLREGEEAALATAEARLDALE